MAKKKAEKWECSPRTKRPPQWVLDQANCSSKAEIEEKWGRGKVFVRQPAPT